MNNNKSETIEPFHSPWWCRNPHCQTMWPRLLRRQNKPALQREALELPDSDFAELDWLQTSHSGPIVVILHGLEGSSDSHYIKGLLNLIAQNTNWRAVVLHFRACGGKPNRKRHSYHAGQTEDVDYFIKRLQSEAPDVDIAIVGYSLGGNVLLKWLGTHTVPENVKTAVAISVPYELGKATDRLNRGISKLYQQVLLRSMRETYHLKQKLINLGVKKPLNKIKTIRDFDDKVIAFLNGFHGADDYYQQSSSRQFLRKISTPTLLIHAKDDPFMVPDIVPGGEELSESTTLECYDHGGHVGFVQGAWPWQANYWLENRIVAHLRSQLDQYGDQSFASYQ